MNNEVQQGGQAHDYRIHFRDRICCDTSVNQITWTGQCLVYGHTLQERQ